MLPILTEVMTDCCHVIYSTLSSLIPLAVHFYIATALLAMQSAVIATAVLSVCPSHAGTVSRQMKIGSCNLYCEVTKTL